MKLDYSSYSRKETTNQSQLRVVTPVAILNRKQMNFLNGTITETKFYLTLNEDVKRVDCCNKVFQCAFLENFYAFPSLMELHGEHLLRKQVGLISLYS